MQTSTFIIPPNNLPTNNAQWCNLRIRQREMRRSNIHKGKCFTSPQEQHPSATAPQAPQSQPIDPPVCVTQEFPQHFWFDTNITHLGRLSPPQDLYQPTQIGPEPTAPFPNTHFGQASQLYQPCSPYRLDPIVQSLLQPPVYGPQGNGNSQSFWPCQLGPNTQPFVQPPVYGSHANGNPQPLVSGVALHQAPPSPPTTECPLQQGLTIAFPVRAICMVAGNTDGAPSCCVPSERYGGNVRLPTWTWKRVALPAPEQEGYWEGDGVNPLWSRLPKRLNVAVFEFTVNHGNIILSLKGFSLDSRDHVRWTQQGCGGEFTPSQAPQIRLSWKDHTGALVISEFALPTEEFAGRVSPVVAGYFQANDQQPRTGSSFKLCPRVFDCGALIPRLEGWQVPVLSCFQTDVESAPHWVTTQPGSGNKPYPYNFSADW